MALERPFQRRQQVQHQADHKDGQKHHLIKPHACRDAHTDGSEQAGGRGHAVHLLVGFLHDDACAQEADARHGLRRHAGSVELFAHAGGGFRPGAFQHLV